ncbi:MAG: hypothetical protein ACKOX6_11205 [Bdellovibrio sp.]
MDKTPDKPREFWITDNTDNSGFSVDTEFSHRHHYGSCNVFHVIEYSAVTKLQEMIDHLNKVEDGHILEINRLRKVVEKLTVQRNEALNWAVDDWGRVIHELAPEKDAELAALTGESK